MQSGSGTVKIWRVKHGGLCLLGSPCRRCMSVQKTRNRTEGWEREDNEKNENEGWGLQKEERGEVK